MFNPGDTAGARKRGRAAAGLRAGLTGVPTQRDLVVVVEVGGGIVKAMSRHSKSLRIHLTKAPVLRA